MGHSAGPGNPFTRLGHVHCPLYRTLRHRLFIKFDPVLYFSHIIRLKCKGVPLSKDNALVDENAGLIGDSPVEKLNIYLLPRIGANLVFSFELQAKSD